MPCALSSTLWLPGWHSSPARPNGVHTRSPRSHRLTAQQVPALHWISCSQACGGEDKGAISACEHHPRETGRESTSQNPSEGCWEQYQASVPRDTQGQVQGHPRSRGGRRLRAQQGSGTGSENPLRSSGPLGGEALL